MYDSLIKQTRKQAKENLMLQIYVFNFYSLWQDKYKVVLAKSLEQAELLAGVQDCDLDIKISVEIKDLVDGVIFEANGEW